MDRRAFLASAAAMAALPAWGQDGPLRMRDLYNKDLSFSDLAESLAGQRIEMTGYMAPPLKADAPFFVLTKRPMAVCPFCEPGEEWPRDILAIYTKRRLEVIPFNRKIIVRGELDLGDYVDPELGFFSRVRINDATYERI